MLFLSDRLSLVAVALNETRLTRQLATVLVSVEKGVFPLVYALLAWRQFQALRTQWAGLAALKALPSLSLLVQGFCNGDFLRRLLLMLLMLLSAGTLLMNRPPTALPDKLKHVLVPLVMCFYFVLYGIVDYLPPGMVRNVLPATWQLPFALAGVAFSLLGYSLSLWAICYLGRAFGLLVSVREVVMGGPYAYVRHPIYTGYLLDSLGLLLVTGSPAMLGLVTGFIGLMICRARLEEDKLEEVSVDYRTYRRQTGSFFPRRRVAGGTEKD